MKTLPFLLIFALSALLYGHGDYRDGYRDAGHRVTKIRYVDVVRSKPIYEDVVTYRTCRVPGHRHGSGIGHQGALIGGLIGGIVGHHLDTRHHVHATVGGAVAGAIIGSKLADARHRSQPRCKVVETRLTGYRNIAYWRGEKIVQISDRPLRTIRVRVSRPFHRH